MRTLTVNVRVGSPVQAPGRAPFINLEFVDPPVLHGGERLYMLATFPIGPDDVGLVFPLTVAICAPGEDEPPYRDPVDDDFRKVLGEARAELARKRAAGELPPPSAEDRRLMELLRSNVERASKAGQLDDVLGLEVGGVKARKKRR